MELNFQRHNIKIRLLEMSFKTYSTILALHQLDYIFF